jgi:hypothetical protein
VSKNAEGRKSGVGGAWSSGSSKARGVSGCGQQYTHWELCCSRDSSRSVVGRGGGRRQWQSQRHEWLCAALS